MFKDEKLKKLTIYFLVCLFFIIGDKIGYFNWLKYPLFKVVRPVQLRIRDAQLTPINNKNELIGLIDQAEIIKLKQENERLRELLGTKVSPSWIFIPGKIIKSDLISLVIDVGVELDVKPEMVVMGLARDQVNNGVLLGGIKEAGARQSKVRLLTDKESRVDVITESGSQGVIEGDGERLKLTHVLQRENLNEGELIISKGGDGWPGDVVVAKVGKVNRVDTQVYLEAEVIELLRPQNLRQVFVVSF